jgi:hypothetical protein
MSPDELLTKRDLEKFKTELFEFLKPFKEAQALQQQKWFRSKDVRTMLKISTGTLLNLRITGTLNARKIGKIYFYKAEEIEKLLNGPEKKSSKKKV